jgi:hypothetical protein
MLVFVTYLPPFALCLLDAAQEEALRFALAFWRLFDLGGMERETGIEPATNSLEGCDSTIELLPQAPYFILHAVALYS